MGQNVIQEINSFQTFRFDHITKRIINMKNQEDTNIEEFLSIQHILDNNKVIYRFEKNFEIEIISK